MTRAFISGLALSVGLYAGHCPRLAAAQPQEGAAAPLNTAQDKMALRIPAEGKVAFSGMTNNDAAGLGSGAMFYPGFGLMGFLAAVATHGVINESSKNSQKSKLQEEADKVLLPYRDALDKFEYAELLQRSATLLKPTHEFKLLTASEKPADEWRNAWRLDSAPAFQFTQDQSALVLESAIAIYAPGSTDKAKPSYTSVVKVISQATIGDDVASQWADKDTEHFKTVSANLVAQSIEIALNDWAQGATKAEAPHKTVRYALGNAEKMERAQVLAESCERVLMRSLRGALISAPPSPTAQTNSKCAASTSSNASATAPPAAGDAVLANSQGKAVPLVSTKP
jgi:hypothetical protein